MSAIVDNMTDKNTLLSLMKDQSCSNKLHILLSHLLHAYRTIANNLRNGEYSSNYTGTQNTFGDNQLDVDVKTDEGMYFPQNCICYMLHFSFLNFKNLLNLCKPQSFSNL